MSECSQKLSLEIIIKLATTYPKAKDFFKCLKKKSLYDWKTFDVFFDFWYIEVFLCDKEYMWDIKKEESIIYCTENDIIDISFLNENMQAIKRIIETNL